MKDSVLGNKWTVSLKDQATLSRRTAEEAKEVYKEEIKRPIYVQKNLA